MDTYTGTFIKNQIANLKDQFDRQHMYTIHPEHKREMLPAWRMLQDDVAPWAAELRKREEGKQP